MTTSAAPYRTEGARAAAEHPTPSIDVRRAQHELEGHVLRTPVRRLDWLERRVGVPVYAKLECHQHTGSFKYRGALHALRSNATRSIIAASAGNHGFAVAQVARQLGLASKTNICIPTSASPLKREHIAATGVGLIEHGNSLDEAIDRAREIAHETGAYFVSPYNDPYVIAANATIALELLEEVPSATTLVVPVGGGGLICGMALGAKFGGHDVETFGCEPERYATLSESLRAGAITRVIHQPTLADGLAVNLEPDAITYGLVRRHVRRIFTLSEEELAAATFALLVHESLLVEPAGAAAVVACLRLAREGLLKGPVALPVCGGNLHHTTLSRIQMFPYTDPELIRVLELRGRTVADAVVTHARLPQRVAPKTSTHSAAEHLLRQLNQALVELQSCQQEIDDFEQFCESNALLIDASLSSSLREQARRTKGQVQELIRVLSEHPDDDDDLLVRGEAALRFALSTHAFVRSSLEWCSASYDQANVAQFFNLGAQQSPGINYERYESTPVQRVEAQLRDVLGLPTTEFAVKVTSSGMSAYTLVEAFLLRYRLKPGDAVLMAPYIYFEASEQLTSLPGLRCVSAPDYSTATLLAEVVGRRPRALFVDPLSNTVQQRMVDIPRLVSELRKLRQGPLTVVVDGTMVSGALEGDALRSDEQVEVIYYESCSKYLQLGLDANMAGMVAVPIAESSAFERLRRNSGSILYRHGAHLFPTYDRACFRERMLRISRNAENLARLLADEVRLCDIAEVIHPSLAQHPDHDLAKSLPYFGGCVTFSMRNQGHNHRSQLEALIEGILFEAKLRSVHLTKGVSFGFSVPRISAAASMAESEPPFLRLYAGDRESQVDALALCVSNTMRRVDSQ